MGANRVKQLPPLSLQVHLSNHFDLLSGFIKFAEYKWVVWFLQRVRIARNAHRCNSQTISVRPSLRPSVCPSVTFRYCVQTNKDTIVWFSAYGKTILLVSEEVQFIRIFVGGKWHWTAYGHIVYVISPNSVAFATYYVKVVEDTSIAYILREKCSPKDLVFSGIIYGDICRESPPARALKLSDPLSLAKVWHVISHNWETVQHKKSPMGFRLVPKLAKSLTLNDLEQLNGHYFVSFRRIR